MGVTEDPNLPTIDRPDAKLIVVGEWGTHDSAAAVVDTAVDQWAYLAWPQELLSHTAYASEDGHSVLHYSQATGNEGFANFARTKDDWLQGVDAAVPGIERCGVRAYTRQGSVRTGACGAVGCVVLVTFAADSREAATSWVEALLNAAASEAAPAGMLSAHFHISTDGQRVINYAEWVDAHAHQRSVNERQQRSAAAGVIDRAETVHFRSVRRYRYWRGVHT